MDVKKISENVRLNEWMATITACRDSGLSVRQWCKLNDVSEPQYYYWLKRIRTLAVQNMDDGNVNGFIEVKALPLSHSSSPIVVYKGESKIEIAPDCPTWMLETVLKNLC